MENLELAKTISMVVDRKLALVTHGADIDASAFRNVDCCYALYGRAEPCSWCQRAYVSHTKTPAKALVNVGSGLREFSWLPLADQTCLCVSAESTTPGSAQGVPLSDSHLVTSEEMGLRRSLDTEMLVAQVCHDLRSPLFTLKGFLSMFMEVPELALLPEIHRRRLGRIWDSVLRLESTMQHIVEYAAIGSDNVSFNPVDMSAMASAILEEMRAADPQRLVDCRVAKNVRAFGDEQMLYRLMENMLGNAWKYSSRKPLARVEFATVQENGRTVHMVRDNGVGFDMEQSHMLFKPFHRLHAMDDFPGTGLGLASVKRILDIHHGAIWFDAVVGHGATFYFTLPEAPA